jgi:SAM-dependent methyltransferase
MGLDMLTVLPQTSSTYHASDGAAYEMWLGRWARRLAEVFLDFVEFPNAGGLLDAGCGTGALTFAMAARWPGRRVVGIDLAPPFISFACSRRAEELPVFEIGDACALPYADGQFAGAAAHLVLIFIPRPELALHELRRVTRPGGTVAAALWDFRGGLVFERMLWDVAVGIDPQARVVRDRRFTSPLALPDRLAQLFRNEALTQVEQQSLTVRTDYADFDDYWQPLLGGQGPVGTYFANLAPDLRARIREAVFDAYCSGAADGPRSLTATAWAVRGKVP